MKKVTHKNELEVDFASILRNLRVKVGLSQGAVRKALGYTSPQFVSNWERGASEPPLETLAKLAVLYRVPLESLVETYIQFRVQRLERELRAKIPKAALKKTA